MSSRRLASLLGPFIALVLIGGVLAAVLGGPDEPGGAEFAQQPTEPDETQSPEPTAEPTAAPATEDPGAQDPATEDPGAQPTASPTAESSPDAQAEPIASEQPLPAPGGPASPSPSPAPAPGPPPTRDDSGSSGAVTDPTALTGGWQGGTPNTGTAAPAIGLLLLAGGGVARRLRRGRA